MSNWPNWLKESIPSWLESTNYPARGVGDQDDLQFKMSVGEGGRWIGFINPGWYYASYKEQYNFVSKGTKTASTATVNGTLVESNSYRPAWGPILVESASGIPYIQHNNSFTPGVIQSWTAAGSGLMYCNIPSGCIVTGARDLSPLMLGSVNGLKDLISNRYYFFDESTRRLWVRPKDVANVEIWIDLLFTAPILKFTEMVVHEADGVRLSYKNALGVVLQRGNEIESIGAHVSGYIDHNLTDVYPGDWIIASYYIQRSFVLLDHRTIAYYTVSPSGEIVTANYETSLPDIIPSLTLSSGSQLNLNPLYSGSYRTGYLSHLDSLTTPVSGLWVPQTLYMETDKTQACRTWNEHVKLTIALLSEDSLPVPKYPLTLSFSAGTTVVMATSTTSTDERGELHALFIPAASGTVATVTCGSLSKTLTISNVAPSEVVGSSVSDGSCFLCVDESRRTLRGNRKIYTNLCYGDGIPMNGTVTLRTQNASELEVSGALYSQVATVGCSPTIDNPLGVQTTIGYSPEGLDRIYAKSGNAQSPIIEVGNE